MVRAVWNGAVLAESHHTVKLEGSGTGSGSSASPGSSETPATLRRGLTGRILARLHRMRTGQ